MLFSKFLQNILHRRMVYIFLFILLSFVNTNILNGQDYRFQQKVDYKMVLDFDWKNHQYSGKQVLKYKNNSRDTLYKLYYHLYFNAFQPGSDMDEVSRHIKDPDKRVADRIFKLKRSEYGFVKVMSLTKDGQPTKFNEQGTILEVILETPILPGRSAKLEMEFLAQIPLQIRRTGRNNKEGIEYSVSQGYPKICGYDEQGWHANPYIAREFYGPFGNFDVTINMPSQYIVAATGVLQNPEEIGHGYAPTSPKKKEKMLSWRFVAKNVHDFVWAADPDYKHLTYTTYNGKTFRYFYQENDKTKENWENLPKVMDEVLQYLDKNYGEYPYPEYSFIQGGDGGMEYPMATLITGERPFNSLVGVSIHEFVHSWYQGVIATNEALFHWMDEGFTNYVSAEVMNHLKSKKMVPGEYEQNPQMSSVLGYINFTTTGLEESMSTHADHFLTNAAYGNASYTKGQVLLEQLKYVIGDVAFKKGMKRYYDEWKFKHPKPNDFFRVMEKSSGIELDWFKEYFVYTTHTIDYSVHREDVNGIVFRRIGRVPMPLDVTLTLKNGEIKKFHIPLDVMRGAKKQDATFGEFAVAEPWPWARQFYTLKTDIPVTQIMRVKIDETDRLADVEKGDNHFPRQKIEGEDFTK